MNNWWQPTKQTIQAVLALTLIGGLVYLALGGNREAIAAVIAGSSSALTLYFRKD